MSSSDISFLLDNAPSDEYKEKLLKLVNQPKKKYLKEKFNIIMSFIKFIEKECEISRNYNSNLHCKLYGSFVRQFFESIYSNIDDEEYGNVKDHDVDICIFKNYDSVSNDIFMKLIHLFKTIIVSKSKTFNINGYFISGIYDKTIDSKSNKVKENDTIGRKLLYDIPHYEIILENDEKEKIYIDLLAYQPYNINDEYMLWNNDFDINGLYMTKNGIFLNNSEKNFFEIQNSIIKRHCNIEYPFENILKNLKSVTNREEKIVLLNQIIHFITFRMKILDSGYEDFYSETKMLKFFIEKNETCNITGLDAPYIKLELECSHILSIMAIANIVNIRSSEYTESIRCPYCRNDLVPLLIEKKTEKIKIPVKPIFNYNSKEDKTKEPQFMSMENIMSIIRILSRNQTDDNTPNTDIRYHNYNG
jgi:hypothetical protein